jgi:hypothetical protein
MSFDIVIPHHKKDSSILPFCVESIKQYALGARTIYVVSAEDPEIEEITWIPESKLPFTKDDVATYIKHAPRVGWYYQQLIKLYLYDYLPTTSSHILILDSDVILRRPIKFFKDDKICFSINDDYYEPYFIHMDKLIPGLKGLPPYSGVCHHIMTRREHMKTFLTHVERIHGMPAWKAMLSLVNHEDYKGSGMADYELYFSYCLQYFPDEYIIRPLYIVNLKFLHEINNSVADMVAIHSWR